MANDVQIRVGMQNTASPELKKLLGDADRTKSTFDKLKDSCFSLGGAFAGLSIGVIARELLDIGMKAQALANSFKAITGSTGGATVEMQFLRQEADRLGLDLYASADAYKGLAAAAKGTALEGRATRDIFVAVSEAATVLGLSADTTQGALLALQQMVSKGTVAAEELRGQLGERLPGAFQLAAKAMGVSTAELGKMLEQGKIVAEDFLPKFAKALHEQYGKAVEDATDSAVANINRLKNSWDELKLSFAESGVFAAMIKGVKGTTSAVKELDATLGALKMQWGVWDQIGQEMIIKAKQGAVMATRAYNSEYQKEYDALQAQLEELRNRYRETYDEAYRLRRQLEREGTGGLHQGKLAPSAPSKGKPDDKALKAAAKLRENMLAEDVKAAERRYKLWEDGEKAWKDYNDNMFAATATQYEKDMKVADQWLQDRRNNLLDMTKSYEEFQTKLTETEAAADEMRGIAHYEEMKRQIEAATEIVGTILDDFNQSYAKRNKTVFDLEREQLEADLAGWESHHADKAKIAELYSKRLVDIARAEQAAKLTIYQDIAGQIAGTFMNIAQAGGRQSEKAFKLYQAFAIAQSLISGYMAFVKTLAEPLLPFPTNVAMAYTMAGMTAVQVAMIAAAKPPSYDLGGISSARGIYQTGDIAEAHIPLQSGRVPVRLSGSQGNTIVNINLSNPIFQDLETQRRTMVQIADIVARRVAPQAVIQNYRDDGEIRQMVRSRI